MSDDDVFEVGRKTIYWMIASFVIGVLMIAFVIIIAGYQGKLTAVPGELKTGFITLRFVTSPDCFAYQDATGRVFPYTIDLSKFTEERMVLCYLTDPEKGYETFNFRLMLGDGTSVKTNNYYQIDHFSKKYDVLVWDGSAFTKDTLSVLVQEGVSAKPFVAKPEQLSPGEKAR